MNVKGYRLNEQEFLESVPVDDLSPEWATDRVRRWLNVEAPEPARLRELLAPLMLDSEVLEACLEAPQRPRVASYGNAFLIALPAGIAEDHEISPYLFIVCLPDHFIITIHQKPFPFLTTLAMELSGKVKLSDASVIRFLCRIIDSLADATAHSLIEARQRSDQLTNTIDDNPDSVDVGDILALKRRIGQVAAMSEDVLYCVIALQRVESLATNERLRQYHHEMRSAVDYIFRTINRLETSLKDLHDHYLLTAQDRTNSRLRLLTMISAVFLPLTLIAGIYGMNFKDMPELGSTYGYPGVLGLMVIVAVGLLWLFHRRGWFR